MDPGNAKPADTKIATGENVIETLKRKSSFFFFFFFGNASKILLRQLLFRTESSMSTCATSSTARSASLSMAIRTTPCVHVAGF